MRIKQSVSAPTFMYSAGMTFEQVAEAAADIGYAGVEVWSADELAKQSKFAGKLGLRMTSFIGTGEPLNDPAARDEAVQTMVKCIDMAADLVTNSRQGIVPWLSWISSNWSDMHTWLQGLPSVDRSRVFDRCVDVDELAKKL